MRSTHSSFCLQSEVLSVQGRVLKVVNLLPLLGIVRGGRLKLSQERRDMNHVFGGKPPAPPQSTCEFVGTNTFLNFFHLRYC